MAPKQKVVSKKHIARLERERRQIKLIQYITIGVISSIILILAYGYFNVNFLQERQPVAEVNGEKITTKEFQIRVVLQRENLISQYINYYQYQQYGLDVTAQLQQIQGMLDGITTIGNQVLDTLIQEALIRQEAEKRGITVSDDEVETYMRQQFGFFPDGTPTPTITPTPVDFTYPTLSAKQLALVTITPTPTDGPTVTPSPTATIDTDATPEATPTTSPTPLPSPTATPYTLEGYENQVNEIVTRMKELGLTEAQYRDLYKTELLRSKLMDEVVSAIPAEEEQVWARHILVADKVAADVIIERLKNGEDFGSIAAELSEDTGTAVNGGDLGWFGKGQMVPSFEEAAFGLDVGEISEPIESDFGWHIIQVLGHTTVPLSANAYEQARQTAFNKFLDELRTEADINLFDDLWMERVPTSPSLQDYGVPTQ